MRISSHYLSTFERPMCIIVYVSKGSISMCISMLDMKQVRVHDQLHGVCVCVCITKNVCV